MNRDPTSRATFPAGTTRFVRHNLESYVLIMNYEQHKTIGSWLSKKGNILSRDRVRVKENIAKDISWKSFGLRTVAKPKSQPKTTSVNDHDTQKANTSSSSILICKNVTSHSSITLHFNTISSFDDCKAAVPHFV
jgi:hypothetical protein